MATPEPAVIAVELAGREGARLRWDPLWTDDASPSPWRLESEPDWRRLESIRLVSATFDDGAALGVAALRPRDAHGHGDDIVFARLVDADGEETATSEALISVEYDAEGAPRRLGLELWPEPESTPLRVAANRTGEAEAGSEGRATVPMRFRLGGTSGRGVYEILRSG
jgi:hypothetical protein